MTEIIVTRYRGRTVHSWAAATHYPVPRLVDGQWRCECGRRLSRYRDDLGRTRLRHYWRDR